MDPDEHDRGEDGQSDGTVDSVEVREVPEVSETLEVSDGERCKLRDGDVGDLGGGVGGVSGSWRSWGLVESGLSALSASSSNEGEFSEEEPEVVDEAPSSIAVASSCSAASAASGALPFGVSSGASSPAAALSPSPSKNIRESLITLSVGRLMCSRRRDPSDCESTKLRAFVGEGGSSEDGPGSSHGSSGKWAPGRPFRTWKTLRPSAHQHISRGGRVRSSRNWY